MDLAKSYDVLSVIGGGVLGLIEDGWEGYRESVDQVRNGDGTRSCGDHHT